ncbi:hypothetical protein PG999_008451 [Apiospora kogelbergensis]|uniref:Uncharacterized protein n=1 Tax=Apiospora kogelbergensis TaxID=1337665 RepID=A0AAW0QGD3_9PEZI
MSHEIRRRPEPLAGDHDRAPTKSNAVDIEKAAIEASRISPRGPTKPEHALPGRGRRPPPQERAWYQWALFLLALIMTFYVGRGVYGTIFTHLNHNSYSGTTLGDPAHQAVAVPHHGPWHRESMVLTDRAIGTSAAWIWSLASNGSLLRKDMGRSGAGWEDCNAPKFLSVPKILSLSSGHLSLAIDAETGHMMQSPFRELYGQGGVQWVPESAWSNVGSHQFAYPPSMIEGDIDRDRIVYAVAANGSLFWNRSSRDDNSLASEWEMVAHGFTGAVEAAHFEELYLIGLKDGEYQYSTFAAARDDWHPLGVPDQCRGEADLGWPMVVRKYDAQTLILVTCGGKIWYKMNRYEPRTRCARPRARDWNPADCWSQQWTPFGNGPDDLHHLTHAQTHTRDRIFSRTSTGCVYQIGAREPGPWQKLWCPDSPRALSADDARTLTLAVAETFLWLVPQSFTYPPISVLIGDVNGKLYYNSIKPTALAVDMHTTPPPTEVDGRPYLNTFDQPPPIPTEDRVIPPFQLLERPE